jgi:hypothetical protein
MFLLMFECCVTNMSKLYGAYDSIRINVVFFWRIFVTNVFSMFENDKFFRFLNFILFYF